MNKKKYIGIREIARLANVSIATVDRVLHKRPGVASFTKKKIEQIIKEVGYKPNIIASRLASTKLYRFAVLIPAVSEETDFWQSPLDGVKKAEEAIGELGITVDLYFFDLKDRNSFLKQVEKVSEDLPDGILLAPSFLKEARDAIKIFQEKQIPYVLIDSSIPDNKALSYIGPHIYNSGIVGAQLVDMVHEKSGDILILNIAKEVDDHNNLLEIEQGFRSYFEGKDIHPSIHKLDITLTDHVSISKVLNDFFEKNDFPQIIFVTNSRIYSVAKYFEDRKESVPFLIGFDYISKNIEYLEKGIIDILICHKSEEQGYKGIMSLYQYFVLGEKSEPIYYMPIDILMRENYKFYHN